MVDAVDIRGSGLAKAQRVLAGLEEHPEQLDLERRRFSDFPLVYKSDTSGTTTRSQSPNPLTEDQRFCEQRRIQLGQEADASYPRKQFTAQVEEERKRIWDADSRMRGMDMLPGDTFRAEACETVKTFWIEQGIWNNKWSYYSIGRWKHEEPLELDIELETDKKAKFLHSSFSLFSTEPQLKPRVAKSDEEKRQITERQVIRERGREASRPYHQFIAQVSRERERIQKESANKENTKASNINTRAYEIVRNTWTRRGIWNTRWGILPGMSWKHEEPLEEEATDGSISALRNSQPHVNHEAANGRFSPLFRPISPVGSNLGETPADVIMFKQRQPADIISAELENRDAEQPLPGPRSPCHEIGKRTLHSTKGQALRPNRRKQSRQTGLLPLVGSASLGPVRLSKVSKAVRKTKPGRQPGLNISQVEPQLSPPPIPITPRRSRRIQPPISKDAAQDQSKTLFSDPLKRGVRTKRELKVANNPISRSSRKTRGRV